VLRDSPKLAACVVKRVYAYGLGRPTSKDDRSSLGRFQQEFAGAGFRFTALLRIIATDDEFFAVGKTGDERNIAVASATTAD
jgi:hypothetical protein